MRIVQATSSNCHQHCILHEPCYNQAGMALFAFPHHPAYRVTLFYGPDYLEHELPEVQCVFNVKKRSWKGGVQISVFILESQMLRLKEGMAFDHWLQSVIADIPPAVCSDVFDRAQDLLAQQLCYLKLTLALERGIPQEHGQIVGQQFLEELDEQVRHYDEWLKQQIVNELDVESLFDHFLAESDDKYEQQQRSRNGMID